MRFINTREVALEFHLVPKDKGYKVDPIGEVDIPNELAHAVKLYGLPLEQISSKPKEEPKPEVKPEPRAEQPQAPRQQQNQRK